MKRTPVAPDIVDGGEPDGAARAGGDDRGGSDGSSTAWKIAAVVLCVLAVASLGAVGWLLFGPGSDDASGGKVLACVPSRDFRKDAKGKTCPPKGAEYVDGIVGKDADGTFQMTTLRGKELQLNVREPDREFIDVAHAQSHAALGQPVRVYTKQYQGQEIVIYMMDTPLTL